VEVEAAEEEEQMLDLKCCLPLMPQDVCPFERRNECLIYNHKSFLLQNLLLVVEVS
jgi:hypothetical protein